MKFTDTRPGTSVYCAQYGRGVVVRNNGEFIAVRFESKGRIYTVRFTADGKDAAGNRLHFFNGEDGAKK